LDEMQETKFDIFEVLLELKVSESTKQHLYYWVKQKIKGREGADERLCGMIIALRSEGLITPEQGLKFVLFARDGQRQKENALLKAFKCLLK